MESRLRCAIDASVDWYEDLCALHGVGSARAIACCFPGRPLVGYERGEALEAALAGGFTPLGELRAWVRQ